MLSGKSFSSVLNRSILKISSIWLRIFLSFDVLIFFFFFQAEDGIRDLYVTGVQTCDLPISRHALTHDATQAAIRPKPASVAAHAPGMLGIGRYPLRSARRRGCAGAAPAAFPRRRSRNVGPADA